ncbi:uncharacterized protein LOC117895029 [Drosophila subobscura]|uniref:uncharacterized protein LOC117895029 n=1 Tax=Drosophila subobscura TaxID=7241 RepID=UPI00155A1BB8|nr:uncharacterized protein LOC117895029 [Drosophila subobscura]
MHSSQILAIFIIFCAAILISNALPYREFSDEDDERLNEISGEWGNRKLVFPRLDRLFGSAEKPSGNPKKIKVSTKTKRNNDRGTANGDTTESSKHAHSMITSMLTFVSSVMNFGRSFIKDQ